MSVHCAERPGTSANLSYALDELECDRIDHGYRVLDELQRRGLRQQFQREITALRDQLDVSS